MWYPEYLAQAVINMSNLHLKNVTLTEKCTRSLAITEGLHEELSDKTDVQLYTAVWKIIVEKACSRPMTLKVTQGHPNFRYSTGHISLPISGL